MPVNLPIPKQEDLLPIQGIRLGVASAGIKTLGRLDLVLIEIVKGASCSSVYTKNSFCAAPVIVAKQHQQQITPRYLLINSGNANAGTGEQGLDVAQNSCQLVANLTAVEANTVLPFSTGVIGQQLAIEKIEKALPDAVHNLRSDNWFDAAQGIMTTDTIVKALSKQIEIDGVMITVTGMAKGSGMVCPDMATVLSYIATDAAVEQSVLDEILINTVDQTFNRITVDGDTSTNDACVLIATAQAANGCITDLSSNSAQCLSQTIAEISQQLAHAIVRDGEGATKFVSIIVEQGQNKNECRQIAYTIAHSPLVKTALFASDPNWGRILAAVGRSDVTDLDVNQVSIYLDELCIVSAGEPAKNYTEEQGQQIMKQDEITIRVTLGRGDAMDIIWTCDFVI